MCVMSPVTNETRLILWMRLPQLWPRSSSPTGCLREAWCPAPQRRTQCPNGTAHHPPGWGWVCCSIHPVKSRETEYGYHMRNTACWWLSSDTHLNILVIAIFPESTWQWVRVSDINKFSMNFFGVLIILSKPMPFIPWAALSVLIRLYHLWPAFAAVVVNLAVLWIAWLR